jgi:hypothetical protein
LVNPTLESTLLNALMYEKLAIVSSKCKQQGTGPGEFNERIIKSFFRYPGIIEPNMVA